MIDPAAREVFTEHLERELPSDLPARDALVRVSARHLALLKEENRRVNLTSLQSPQEMVVKHVVDSVFPYQLLRQARTVLDLGSGGGFPGLPLAVCLPARVILSESVGKKAAFLRLAVEASGADAEVCAERAEMLLRDREVDVVVARAVGSAAKLLRLLKPVAANFRTLLLYKGPKAREELEEGLSVASRLGFDGEVAMQYELPHGFGTRAVLRFQRMP